MGAQVKSLQGHAPGAERLKDDAENRAAPRSVLITGASGYIGRQAVAALAADRRGVETVAALDLRAVAESQRVSGVDYREGDVRDPALGKILSDLEVDTVVHLAAIVMPGGDEAAEEEYSVDVLGTRNVLESCVGAGVKNLVITSSGAAYGYYRDNPDWLDEEDAIRGNDSFRYSRHKRLVEEMAAEFRRRHPSLGQLVFRPGTVLGETVNNQITALFEAPLIVGIRGAATPFVFIWDRDVVACILKGVHERRTGIYNLAGDGVVSMAEIARRTGKPYLALPAWMVAAGLKAGRTLGLSPYGPEQVDFLRYRPVLSNSRLKREFGYTPSLNSSEVFDLYWEGRGDG